MKYCYGLTLAVLVLVWAMAACKDNPPARTVTTSSTQPVRRGDWYMPYHDNANTNRSNTLVTRELQVRWCNTKLAKRNDGICMRSAVVFYSDHTGLFTENGRLHWIDPEGKPRKSYALLEYSDHPTPSLTTEGEVAVSTRPMNVGSLLLIDPNGKLLQQARYPSEFGSYNVLIDNQGLYILKPDLDIIKIDKDLNVMWKYGDGALQVGSNMEAVDQANNIYVLLEDGTLLSLSSEGKLNWEFKSDQEMAVNSPIVCQAGVIIPGWKKLDLVSFDGKLKWQFELDSQISGQAICLTGAETIVAACDGGTILCVDMQGKELWRVANLTTCTGIIGSSKNNLVYALHEYNMEVMSAENGESVSFLQLEHNALLGRMSVNDAGCIVFGDSDGNLFMLERDGRQAPREPLLAPEPLPDQ